MRSSQDREGSVALSFPPWLSLADLHSLPTGIAHALETKIYCDDKKLSILQAQDDPELHALITRDPLEAQVHVCWLQDIKHDALADYLGKYSAGRMEGGFTKLIGLRPTGGLSLSFFFVAREGQQRLTERSINLHRMDLQR